MKFNKFFLWAYKIVLVICFICPALIGCRQINDVSTELPIDIQPIFSNYEIAKDLAKNWEANAQLVSIRIRCYYSSSVDVLYLENFITFRFEDSENNNEYLVIECINNDCEPHVNDFFIRSDGSIISLLQEDWTPIDISQLKLDSKEIITIAKQAGEFNLLSNEYNLSAMLTGNSEYGLFWDVVYSGSDFREVKIDPISGEVLDLDT